MTAGRKTLPSRRRAQLETIEFGGIIYEVGFGEDPVTGEILEVFISTPGISGSEVEAICSDGAVLISLALQNGLSLEQLDHSLLRVSKGIMEPSSEPASIIGYVIGRLREIEGVV